MKKLFRIIDIRRDTRDELQRCFSTYLKQDMDVYDIGCGSKPFAEFLNGRVKSHVGVDIDDGFYDASHIDVIGSAYDVPVDDGVAGAVISSQVIEHLDKPEEAIAEIKRLLKPKGILLLSFPFLYPMHAEPHDYLRYTEFYINRRLEEQGFEVIEKIPIGGFWYCLGMYFDMYLQNFDRGILKKLRIVKVISFIFKWFFNLIHVFEGFMVSILKRDIKVFRNRWTVNYIYVARKL